MVFKLWILERTQSYSIFYYLSTYKAHSLIFSYNDYMYTYDHLFYLFLLFFATLGESTILGERLSCSNTNRTNLGSPSPSWNSCSTLLDAGVQIQKAFLGVDPVRHVRIENLSLNFECPL